MASSFTQRAAPATPDQTEAELQHGETASVDAPQLLSLAELAQVAGGDDAVVTLPVNGW